MRRPKRNTTCPQAPHPWRRQVEGNIFYKHRGWWHEAHEETRDDASKAHWRQFFGWPPPLDTARLGEIFTTTFRERLATVADAVEGSNALLRFLR